MGLSFGSFYTIIIPMVNEMYGTLEFGKLWGAQMSSQAGRFSPAAGSRRSLAGHQVCIQWPQDAIVQHFKHLPLEEPTGKARPKPSIRGEE